jgi:hypothetical protein
MADPTATKPKVKIYRMKDSSVDYRVKKDRMFDLPMRLLIVGKSMLSGKSNYFCNLLSRPFDARDKEGAEMYRNDFKPENIYIVCPSTDLDDKISTLVRDLNVPATNIFPAYDEAEMNELYDNLQAQFQREKEQKKITQKLIIFDDVSYSGDLKKAKNGAIARIFMNGRHLACSCIVTAQKYSDIPTSARENATGLVLFECSRKQLELIADDHAPTDKKTFFRKFEEVTSHPHSPFIINYSNPRSERFMNSEYEPISL